MMDIIDAIVIIACGLFCIPSIIARKKPEAKELLATIAQFQGWIGLACFVWGIIKIIRSIQFLDWINYAPIDWITLCAFSIILTLVGFLLSYGMLLQFVLKNASGKEKTEAADVHKKINDLQIPLGFACLIIGVWIFVWYFVLK